MIIKLGTVEEVSRLEGVLSSELFNKVTEVATILDDNYGDRNIYSDYGGYIVVVDNESDLLEYSKVFNYIEEIIEFAEIVEFEPTWVQVLYMLSSDFGITIFLPKEIAPSEIVEKVEVQ